MAPKTVLITGSSVGGIGHALVLAFQKRGFTVFATARSLKKMTDLETLPNVHLIALDVTSPGSIASAVKEVETRTGWKLDVMVNNAGVQYVMPLLDVDVEVGKSMFEVNYWAVVRMSQAFSNMLIAAKGTIVNVGSAAGVLPLPFQGTYNASKAAVNMFSENLRLELAPFGVRVITLMAGNVTSNIDANSPKVDIPSTSRYAPVKGELESVQKYSDMPTEKFAEVVVNAVVGSSTGKVWAGGNVWVIRAALFWLPSWAIDKLMVANGRGLQNMPKM